MTLCARHHARGVAAGAGLAEGVGAELRPARQVGKQPCLLLLGAGDHQRISTERLDGEDERARGAHLGHLLDGNVEGQRAAGKAAVLRGEGQREEIVFAEEIHHIPGEFAGAIDLRSAWRDAVASDIAHRLADHGLLFVETDVHSADATKPSEASPVQPVRR